MALEKFKRNTHQRKVMLEELRRLTTHPTAVELYDIVRQRLPNISLGTVYRNLELLAQMNEIQKLDMQGTEARFDGNREPHYHVRCVRCGRVDDVHDLPADPVRYESTQLSDYEIVGHRFEFMGICPECRRTPAPV
jgi:Fur family ferric uptake transcriptional regulator